MTIGIIKYKNMIKIRKQNLRQGIRGIVTLFQYNEWEKIETIFKHTHTHTHFFKVKPLIICNHHQRR